MNLLRNTAHQRWYGTRLSTVILVRTTGEVLFVERDRVRLHAVEPTSRLDALAATGPDDTTSTWEPEVLSDEQGREAQRVFRFVIAPPPSPAS